MAALEQTAALVALLRARPSGLSWPETATEVLFAGDAFAVWEDAINEEVLLVDPANTAALEDARRDVAEWMDAGHRWVTVLDGDYPRRLLDIRETPPLLFFVGSLLRDDRGMSVVGSRNASARALEVADFAARRLVERGLSVISGLAAGVDTAAHRAALDAHGRTVAFIGTGIAQYYPAHNREIQDEIGRRGVVLSQFWPEAPPTKQSFPMRNAAMSGYGLATIVVEASERSGTRIQARVAIEHGRPVILTDMVVNATTWGRALVGRPGVQVVHGLADLEVAIDRVIDRKHALRSALNALVEPAA